MVELTKDLLARLPNDLDWFGSETYRVREWEITLAWNLTIAALLWFASDRADARWLKANLLR